MEMQTPLAGNPNFPAGQNLKPPAGEAQDNPSNLVGPISDTVPSQACVIKPDDVEKKQEIERKALFENTVNEKLNIPTGYFNVAVLIIRWNENVNEFGEGHSEEIEKLSRLLQDRFNYECEIASLETSKKPQHALNHAISRHISAHDGPNSLLIVYYTGHGSLAGPVGGEQRLKLSATREPNNHTHAKGHYPATAFWGEAEEPLMRPDIESDVLAILDCCFASNAQKGPIEDRRVYQLIAASPKDANTPGPGPNSFTNALIKSLEDLVTEHGDRNFTTAKLIQRINTNRSQPSMLWDRLDKHERLLQLAPVQRLSRGEKSFRPLKPAKAWVEMKFSLLERELSSDQIEEFGRQLPEACKNAKIPVRRIEWVKMGAPPSFAAVARSFVAQTRLRRKSQVRSSSSSQVDGSPSVKRPKLSMSSTPSRRKSSTLTIPSTYNSEKAETTTHGIFREFGDGKTIKRTINEATKGDEGDNHNLGTGIEEYKEDDEGDEEEQDNPEEDQSGELLYPKSMVAPPTEGRSFQVFQKTLNHFINPPTTIEEAMGAKDTKALRILLENKFDVVAQGKYSWICELDDIGYTRNEIADLLFEQANDAPWIYFKPDTFDGVEVQTGVHLPGCAHQYLSLKEYTLDQPSKPPLQNFPITNWQDISESIQELCGLAGIVPISRDRENWNGSVKFKDQNSVAAVTYSRLPNSYNIEHHATISQIVNILERFCLAAGLAQDAGLCCDSFTILRIVARNPEQQNRTEPLIEVCRIDFKLILQLLSELKRLLILPSIGLVDISRFQGVVLQLFYSFLQGAMKIAYDSDISTVLHYCSLAVQLVSLGFLSYSQAHVGAIRPFFLDTSLKKIQLLGLQTTEVKYDCIEATLNNLTCMAELVQGPVLTFDLMPSQTLSEPTSKPTAYDLLTNALDLLDTWGPGQFVIHHGPNKLLSAIKVGGGFVFATDSRNNCFHWGREASLQQLRQGILDPLTKIIIGTPVTLNRSCTINEDQCWMNSTTSLEPLGPHGSHWELDEKQLGVQAGNYIVFQAIAGSHKLPAQTLKQHRLQQDNETLIPFLDNLWGVQVSFCTRIARRVPLREMVADMLPVFAMATISSQDEARLWEELKTAHDIISVFQHENIREWLIALPPQLHQQVLKIVRKIFNVLQHTGLDRAGEYLLIAWPHERDTFRCFKVPCKEESSWAGILADSEDCATFAYISTKCFETTKIKCSGSNPTWKDTVPLLETAVVLHSTSPTALTAALQHNETYFFKKLDNLFFVKAQRPDTTGTANLITFRSISPPDIQRRLFVRFREVQKRRVRLRERIANEDRAEQVAVSQLTRS